MSALQTTALGLDAAVHVAEDAIMTLRHISVGRNEGDPVAASKALVDIATRAASDPVIKAALESIEEKRLARRAGRVK